MGSNARGLYEVLITEAIEAQLRDLDSNLHATTSALRSAEAGSVSRCTLVDSFSVPSPDSTTRIV